MKMWPKGIYQWVLDRTLCMSIPFTWLLPRAKVICLQRSFDYDRVVVGGPAVRLMPEYLSDVAEVGNDYEDVLQMVNPQATRTTEGCPNRCGFCGVRKIYPKYRELNEWPLLPVVCDDNFLACSDTHFNRVMDRLKTIEGADFNQGLDAELFPPRAARFAELRKPLIRFAWDNVADEDEVMKAIAAASAVGVPKSRIRVLVLIGYNDTPIDAKYRLDKLYAMGVTPNAMRYTPLDALERHYVNTARGWTEELLLDYMKFYNNRRFFKNLPFEKFDRKLRGKRLREANNAR